MERLNLNETETDIHPAVKRLLKEKTDKQKKAVNKDLQRRTSVISTVSTRDLKYKCEDKMFEDIMNTRFLRSLDSAKSNKSKDKEKEKEVSKAADCNMTLAMRTMGRRRTLYISGDEINEAKLDYTMECLDGLLNKKRTRKNSKNTAESIRKSITSCKSRTSRGSKVSQISKFSK